MNDKECFKKMLQRANIQFKELDIIINDSDSMLQVKSERFEFLDFIFDNNGNLKNIFSLSK